VNGDCANVPSVDAMLDHRRPPAGQPRLSCCENIDKDLMTKVVPWVPFQWGNDHDILGADAPHWALDQASGSVGYAHVALTG